MFRDCEALSGFHPVERDEIGPFVWTGETFQIRLARAARYLQLKLCHYAPQGWLTIRNQRGWSERLPLDRGWRTRTLSLADVAAGDVLEFAIEPIIRVPGDTRTLGVMLREVEPFDDDRRFEMLSAVDKNGLVNQREYMAGRIALDSLPQEIRVNLEVRCNIPETSQACVYCAWDWGKLAERGSPAFTIHTLDDLGDFYRCASQVNDCSIGEPTMNKDFGNIVAQLDRDQKWFSFTSNGQLLTPRRRRQMLGKNIYLYVSLDSATAAGYARYRNDRFDEIIDNLRALCREKKQAGNLPRVFVSFIVMRSNAEELPEFMALMRDVGIDEIKLRALYLDDNLELQKRNNRYDFDYVQEIVDVAELNAMIPWLRALSQEHEMPVHIEWEQFPTDVQQAGGPLCSEPWRTLYILRRGIMPCCYATEPVATWEEQQGRPLDTFLREVYNGSAMQEIRSALAEGRLADYCQRTPSCPILKSLQARGEAAPSSNGIPLPLIPLEALSGGLRSAT